MQLTSDSKKEVIKRKLICWLDNLHLRLCKEKLGYQFDPTYRCSSNMILSKEIYLRLQDDQGMWLNYLIRLRNDDQEPDEYLA